MFGKGIHYEQPLPEQVLITDYDCVIGCYSID
jgi:hypothetical protein